jgi:hypothetical protein
MGNPRNSPDHSGKPAPSTLVKYFGDSPLYIDYTAAKGTAVPQLGLFHAKEGDNEWDETTEYPARGEVGRHRADRGSDNERYGPSSNGKPEARNLVDLVLQDPIFAYKLIQPQLSFLAFSLCGTVEVLFAHR